ncbi:hypothetical protein Agub_g3632 [Astrephomene gubernaculifera]|uniref:LysM domain-containing protein n=1 Tax=Astrephomene gubernaculifera TaxID=47775 RepID=A0AAD3HIM5_9CHLO|nr:hypothetical protein Agub_g3632 [Astrephomene gubernaculifera]
MLSVASTGPRGLACGPLLPARCSYHGKPSRIQGRLWALSAAAEAEIGTLHTVQTGETLAQIALAYGVSVEQIREATPKGSRGKRSKLRSGAKLQPGQKLLVPSDVPVPKSATHSVPPIHGLLAGAQGFATRHSHVLAAGLGGLLLALAALRAFALKATAATGRAALQPPSVEAAPAASAVPPSPPSQSQAVRSAVAEVRALLQDAAVEMDAVESALAAVRRATAGTATAAPLPHQAAETAATAPVKEVPDASPAAAATAAAGGSESLAAPADVAHGVAPAAPSPSPAAPSATTPQPSASASADAEPPPAAAAAALETTLPSAEAPSPPATAASTSASLPLPTVTAETVSEPLSSTDAFSTAALVAAARARVESALQDALGVLNRSTPPPMAATPTLAPAAMASAQLLDKPDAEVPQLVPVIKPLPVEPLPTATATAAVGSALPVVTPLVPVEPVARPMDAAAAGSVLNRIRVINKLLEKEELGAVTVTEAEAIPVSSTVADEELQKEASSVPAAAAAAAATDLVVQDRKHAEGLLDKVSVLLSSFDSPEASDVEEEEPKQPLSKPTGGISSAVQTPVAGAAATAAAAAVAASAALSMPIEAPAAAAAGFLGLPALGAAGGAATAAAAATAEEVLGRIRDIGRLLDEPPQPQRTAAGAVPSRAAPAPAAALDGIVVGTVKEEEEGLVPEAAFAPPPPPSPPPLPPLPPQLQPLRHQPTQPAVPILQLLERDPLPPSLPLSPSLPQSLPLSPSLPQSLPLPPSQLPTPAQQLPPVMPPSSPQQPPPLSAATTGQAPSPASQPAASPRGRGRYDATLINLKSGLLDLVYGTSRGVSATPLQRAAIEEFVTALEARNPNAVPTDAVSAVSGRWKLVYTSHVGTLLLLGALDGVPLVDVGEVVQIVDPVTLTATNRIDLAVPMPVSLRAEAGLEVRSPRQFKVRFTRVGLDTYVSTPQLTAALEVPDSVTVLGARLDLSPLRRMLVQPINSGIEAAQGFLGRAVSPELSLDSMPLPPGVTHGSVSDAASLWMLTTYLDDTLRISRDDEGRVFVMLKDVSIYPTDTARRSPR